MTESSFETMTVKKSDIELPYKFSARMKGQNDITVTPQVSGQLMKICVTEGQMVKKGQTLFIIDSRNAQLELEAAQANLQAALAQENSAKLEYESNKNLFDKKIVSSYMLNNSENSYKQAQAAVYHHGYGVGYHWRDSRSCRRPGVAHDPAHHAERQYDDVC